MTNNYKPISCHLYDKLEELAVKTKSENNIFWQWINSKQKI